MVLLTVFLSSLSMIPYIHTNLGGSNLTHFSQWTFPILRAVGGFLTASMMQIVIERRIGRLTAVISLNPRHLITLAKYQATRATPNVLQRLMSHKDRGRKPVQMPVTTAELEMSRKDWVSPTHPILSVTGGQQRASLATQLLPNMTPESQG
jgi:hypothetical protein